MRKLILEMQHSLDGFIGGPNGELDWIFPGQDPFQNRHHRHDFAS